MRWLGFLLCVSCAHVSQDRATGPDGVIEGATKIALVDGVARADGTISYPKGDRVDWFDVTLPSPGNVDVEVLWQGKRAAVELWDDDYVRVAADRPSAAAQREVHGKELAKHAYVRVYAPGIEDGGRYSLVVRFTPLPQAPPIDWANEEIPPPPNFHVTVEPPPCDIYDPKNPACRGVCNPDAPDDACRVCPNPPDFNNPSCQATLPCPNPPDRRIRACFPHRPEFGPPQDVLGRVLKVDDGGDGTTILTIGAGTEQGVTKTMHAVILEGDTAKPFPNGALTILRVARVLTVARTKLTRDAIEANPRVRFTP